MSAVVNKAWMNEPDIFSKTYRDGVKFFMNYAATYDNSDTTCSCPCSKCQNGKRWEMWEVRKHLSEKGIDRSYVVWFFHGEKEGDSTIRRPSGNFIPTEMNDEQAREGVIEDLGSFVDAAYGDFDRGDGVSCNEEVETEEFVPEPDLGKRYYRYKQLSEDKLYPGCNTSILAAIVELHNVKKTYKISANCVNSLLGVIKGWLPKGNNLPVKYTAMKSMLKDPGMKEKSIHMCENHCILYYKENEDLTSCPECLAPRYKVKVDKFGEELSSNEPSKVLRYFPLGPRLKRLYTVPWIARAMTWHDRAEVSSDYMRHPVDSSQWDLVKKKFPEFANEGRNVWLGIATDGFNPHGMQSLNYSCWPVIVVVYNLPPSLCMKPEFQIMMMLIPGPKAPGQDIDVCLRVLVDELKDLFENGISAFDTHKEESFQLRATLMFGIHDLPAQGNMSGCTTHGYFACVHCADKTRSAYLLYARKNVYPNYRIYLRGNHPLRKGENLGLETNETKNAPKRLSGKKSLEKLANVTYKPGKLVVRSKALKRKRYDPDADDDPYGDGVDEELTGAFYKESIFWELKTYRILYFRHCVDVMHTEKNVMEHILETIFDIGNKSMKSWNARDELNKLGLHCGQWTTSKPGSAVSGKPIFVLSKAEKESFCKILKDLKFPFGFASNLSNNVNTKNSSFSNFKSHEYHVIMEYLLPVCLQHAFPKHPELRRALHQCSPHGSFG
ncbi:uncharacterized protein LOC113290358 [Papaver somniferum]|uniref:uncharacterized protein LOC113290358 n=1 Tax=Papaver somniferum TaxID=3469 RepID=UPI000E700BEC|nr:uncharacterized protein LOC113290358 [Papaver somniferum]